jgi:hypothetical protein
MSTVTRKRGTCPTKPGQAGRHQSRGWLHLTFKHIRSPFYTQAETRSIHSSIRGNPWTISRHLKSSCDKHSVIASRRSWITACLAHPAHARPTLSLIATTIQILQKRALRFTQGPRPTSATETGSQQRLTQRCRHSISDLRPTIYTLYFETIIVQCEDLYELISCLLPEVTASPAQHCTYSIFGTKLSWIRSILFAILFQHFCSFV